MSRAGRQIAAAEVAELMPNAPARIQRFEVDRRTLSAEEFREKHYFEDGDLDAAFDFKPKNDAPFLDASVLRRGSDGFPSLPPADTDHLESLIRAHGLRAVLKALREVADNHAHLDACDMGFDQIEDCERWQAAADVLEAVTVHPCMDLRA